MLLSFLPGREMSGLPPAVRHARLSKREGEEDANGVERDQRQRADPALRHWRLPLLHACSGGHGAPLVEGRTSLARAGSSRAWLNCPSRPTLGGKDGDQRLWRALYGS